MIAQKANPSPRRKVASAALVRLDGGPSAQRVALDRPLTLVGSKPHAHLRIISPDVSGSHALFLNMGNNVFVHDLLSRTGVFVNDQPITEARLKFGDIVRFGDVRFRFTDSNLLRRTLSELRAAPAQLRIEGQPQPVRVGAKIFIVGRKDVADLSLPGEQVSKAHAVLYERDQARVLRDLDSRHGTFVNGERVKEAILQDGDVVRIGGSIMHFGLWDDVEPEQEDESSEQSESQPPPVAEDESKSAPEDDGDDVDHVFVSDPIVLPAAADALLAEDAPAEMPADDSSTTPLSPDPEWDVTTPPEAAKPDAAGSTDSDSPFSDVLADDSDLILTTSATAAERDVPAESEPRTAPAESRGKAALPLPQMQTAIVRIPPPDPLAAIIHEEVLTLFSDDANAAAPQQTRRSRRGGAKWMFWILLVVTVVGVAGAGAIWWYLHHHAAS